MNYPEFKVTADCRFERITKVDFTGIEPKGDCAAGVSSVPDFPLRSLGSIELTITPSTRAIRKLFRIAHGWKAKGPVRGRMVNRAKRQLIEASIKRAAAFCAEFGMPKSHIRRYAAAARHSLEKQLLLEE